MTSALSLADQGFDVHIVEKETEPGGLVQNLHRTLDESDVQEFLKCKIDEVQAHPRITLHTGTEVKSTDGFVGNFKTTLKNILPTKMMKTSKRKFKKARRKFRK